MWVGRDRVGSRDRYEQVVFGDGQAYPFDKDRESTKKVSEKWTCQESVREENTLVTFKNYAQSCPDGGPPQLP